MGKISSAILLLLFISSCVSSDNLKNEDEMEPSITTDNIELSTPENNDFIFDTFTSSEEVPLTDTPDENGFLSYQTKKNDTLMLVAFNIYGDYRKWQELAYHNKDVLKDGHDISHMPILRYKEPTEPYQPPTGKPYLIKTGDSLTIISDKVYGDYRKWDYIYKNNQRQIRDPKLIFPGFTLYYPSLLEEKLPH